LGEITLECSRPGASAVALWATQRLLPYEVGGAFARGLEAGRKAALGLRAKLATDSRFVLPIAEPELDIVFWAVVGRTAAEASSRARALFGEARRRDLYLALAELPARFFPAGTRADGASHITCLRSVLMKPEHEAWMDQIWSRLESATSAVLSC
jgi:tyrosine decarboxylase/aspartate 1-decarboxylase